MDHIQVEPAGLAGDRRFMLVDYAGKFITQRTRPDLTRFDLRVLPEGYLVSDKLTGVSKILAFFPTLGNVIQVNLWDDMIQAYEVMDAWSTWFSDLLNEQVRLVQLNSEEPRLIQAKYQTLGSQQSSFADSLPILLASMKSYQAVEGVLGSPFDYLRFRANILVSGTLAFSEDTWAEIKVGEVSLLGAKPCGRCQLVNVEPKTGEVDSAMLKALATFRTHGNQVYFGQQMVPIQMGILRVGDEIQVIKTKDALF